MSYFPIALEAFVAWFINFAKVLGENIAIYDVTQEESDAITALANAMSTSQQNVVEIKAQSKTITQIRDNTKADSIAMIRKFGRIFQANPKLTSDQLEAIGLPVHDHTHSFETPHPIREFVVKGGANGYNTLDWDKNDNKQGTRYFIEARYGLEGHWGVVDNVTATKYIHKGQTPGDPVYYRITPQRGKLVGPVSAVVGVYT
jgi:hypothetical protein